MTGPTPVTTEQGTPPGHRYHVVDGNGGQWLCETTDEFPEPSPIGRVDDILRDAGPDRCAGHFRRCLSAGCDELVPFPINDCDKHDPFHDAPDRLAAPRDQAGDGWVDRVKVLTMHWRSCWCQDEQVRDCPRHGSDDCRHMAEGIVTALRALVADQPGDTSEGGRS